MSEDKQIVYATRDYLQSIAKNCKKAVRSDNPALMLALLINIEMTIGSFITALNDWNNDESDV